MLTISTVWNFIKKWQLMGTLEVQAKKTFRQNYPYTGQKDKIKTSNDTVIWILEVNVSYSVKKFKLNRDLFLQQDNDQKPTS